MPTFIASEESANQGTCLNFSRSLARSLAWVPTLFAAGGINAQTTESAPSTPASAPNGKDDVVELETLEVQGQRENSPLSSPKYTQPLVDVPQTITVIPRSVMDQQGATTLRDVLRNTPGITFQAGEGGTASGDQMTIRGFDARNDIAVDGIRDAGTFTRDAFNLEQVEVAKGPSSTQSGRGSTGANVNLVSKTPKLESFRAGTLGVGTDDYRRATVDINEDLSSRSTIPGTAVRLNAMAQESGVAGRDIVENKQWAVAPSLAFGLGTPTRATLSYLHAEQDNIPDYGIPWVPVIAGTTTGVTPSLGTPGGQPNVDQSNWYGLVERDYEKIINDSVTGTVERDLGANTTLRNTTRYARTERDSVITAPRFVVTGGVVQPLVRRNDEKFRDQVDDISANATNLRTTFDTGPVAHTLSTGLDLSRETSLAYTRVQTPDDALPTSAFDPDPYQPYTAVISRNGAFTDVEAETVGLYVFDTAEITDWLELTGGVRFDHFEADVRDDRRAQTTGTGAGTYSRIRTNDDMVSWKGGVVFKPRPNGSIFIGRGTSFNPSAEGLAVTPANAKVDPEKSESTEIGTKWDLFNRRLNVSASIFRTEKTNARTTDPTTGDVELDGEQRVDGFELGLGGNITKEWNVFAGYTYMDSEVLSSRNPLEVGSDVPRTPQHSFNVWTAYELPFGLTLGGGAQYMDKVDRSTTTTNQYAPGFTLWNAMASYEVNKHFSLRLNANNLFDEAYVDRVGGGHYVPGAGRTFILTGVFAF